MNYPLDYPYWTGGADSVIEGEWRWMSDNALLSNGSTLYESAVPWLPGEPNGGIYENCIVYWTGWVIFADWRCERIDPHGFICEHPRIFQYSSAPVYH